MLLGESMYFLLEIVKRRLIQLLKNIYDGIINRTGNVNLLADFYIMKSASR